jgi:hypothetical protein
MGDKRALAVKILLGNVLVLGLLALATWVGWIPMFEARRGLMTAAFAACATVDALFALFLVTRS